VARDPSEDRCGLSTPCGLSRSASAPKAAREPGSPDADCGPPESKGKTA
jgi:hypothetical protein